VDHGTNVRCERDRNLDPTTVGELTGVLEEVNPFIPIYRTAPEQMTAAGSAYALLTADLTLVMEPGADRRRENLPTASEVAAIVPDVRSS
jgi:hypothetical protein